MDASTLQAAYTGLRIAIDSLKTIVTTKTQIEADQRILTALEQLGRVQDTLFEVRNELSRLQEESFGLKERLREQEGWGERAAKYELVTASGGAVVWRNAGPPEHYACPVCFEKKTVHILQDKKVPSGNFECANCKQDFLVNAVRPWPPVPSPR